MFVILTNSTMTYGSSSSSHGLGMPLVVLTRAALPAASDSCIILCAAKATCNRRVLSCCSSCWDGLGTSEKISGQRHALSIALLRSLESAKLLFSGALRPFQGPLTVKAEEHEGASSTGSSRAGHTEAVPKITPTLSVTEGSRLRK
eukprot:2514656-Pleurochrysis_carterae.AAC.2